MDSVLIGVVISEGVGFIAALIWVSCRVGRVLQWIEHTDYRIEQLEADSHTHNPGSDVKKGGVSKDYGKED